MALTSGTQLGSYVVGEPLGRGGMGEVYRAHDTRLGREVAIKVLPAEFAQDAERLARLEREARMLAALNHPNIAAIYGLEQADDTRFIVLELVEGDTLADQIQRGPLPVEESLQLTAQIAEALEAAHAKGVIHRDLKPGNIKVTGDGRVKVLDFGLAKAFEGEIGEVNLSNSPTLSMQATQQGVILGTAAYMSPEQAKGRAVDKRTDVWALGAVLYEMLTGRQAFRGDEVSEILASVLAREPDYAMLEAHFSPRLQRLLERCLEKDLKERWQDAGDVRIGIRELLADPAGVVGRPASDALPVASSSRLPWVAAIVLAAAVTGVAVWWATPSEPRPVRRFTQSWPADQTPRNTGRAAVALSRDGSSFVYNTIDGLYLRELDELAPRLVPETQISLTNPFFSPDGQWIGFWSGPDIELQKISVNGGAPIPITAAGNPYGATWGDDDSIVFGQPEGIMRVSANGGEAELIVEAGAEVLSSPQVLPGGQWVLFTQITTAAGSWDEGDIVAHSLDTGERRVLVEGGTDGRYVPTGHLVYAFGESLWAVPFDVGSMTAKPGGVRLADGVAVAQATGAANYGFSDDGTLVQLYLEGGAAGTVEAPTSLVYADRSGSIEPIDLPSGTYLHARVSPDGTRLAFQTQSDGRGDIWIHDLSGGTEPRQLTQTGNNSRPIWTPDGAYVTFMSTRDGAPAIWWQTADGSEAAVRLTESDGAEHWPDDWSPDGQTLVFTHFGGVGLQSIFVATPDDGADPVEFVEGQAGAAVFSPDGRWIAYRAARNPADPLDTQIFLKPFPGTGTERQVTQNGGASPLFSRDGTELIYRRAAAETGGPVQNQLISKDISTAGGGVTSGAERALPIQGIPALVGIRDYDVMPAGDDRLVLMLPAGATLDAGAGPAAEFRIVLNWFQELRERVPVPK